MKHWFIALGAPLALAGQPLAAQDEAAQDAMAAMMGAFEVEPLTPEQQARLPLAEAVVRQIVPEGVMSTLSTTTYKDIFEPLREITEPSNPDVFELIGYNGNQLRLTDEQIIEITSIVDPAWKEREALKRVLIERAVQNFMIAMEPAVRKGTSEAYAIHFTARQLEELSAFFSTPTGSAYAAKSLELASNARIASAIIDAMPSAIDELSKTGIAFEREVVRLPKRLTYQALTIEQKRRLLEITGLVDDDLKDGMDSVAADDADSSLE